MLTVQRLNDARPVGRGRQGVSKYNAENPKQNSKRFNSQVRQNTLPIWVRLKGQSNKIFDLPFLS